MHSRNLSSVNQNHNTEMEKQQEIRSPGLSEASIEPKKAWTSPEMTELLINSGTSFVAPESAFAAPSS
jgi:hypothetical protein